jgi:phosphate transport system permease protein
MAVAARIGLPALRVSNQARREKRRERMAYMALGAVTCGVALATLGALGYIAVRGAPALNWEFLSAMPRDGMKAGGILPAIVGTVALVALTVLMALPLGVLAAVYLSEYAKRGPMVRLSRIAILNLAGVPSIVYGLFGMGLFVMVILPAVMGWLGIRDSAHSPACLLAAAATMALLVLPTVITTTDEALRQVPQHQRSANLALGATRWQTIRNVVLPSAMPGILTGLMLSVGRAAGETAPILLTGAAFYMSHMPTGPGALFEPFMSLPYHLFVTSTQLPGAPDSLKWGTALVLLAVVLAFNATGVFLRARLRRGKG